MPSYPEGAIADGPNGAIIYRGGQWVPMNSAPTVVQAPYNPATAYEAPKAAAGLQSTQVNTQGQVIDNQVAAATIAAQIRKTQADAARAEAEAAVATRTAAQGPQVTPQQAEMRDRLSRLEQLTGQIDRVQQLYNAGPGKTKGLSGALDYLPTDSNAAFDAAGAALSQQGLAAFRVPGTGTVSDRDAMMFDRANLPQSGTRDAAIEEQLRGLRARVNAEMTALGRAAPWDDAGKRIEQKDPLHATYLDASDAPKQSAGFGADTKLVPIPEAMQQEYNAYMANWTSNPDVGDYVKFRTALDRKYGYAGDAAKQEEHRSRAEEWQKGLLSRKGYTVPLGIGGAQQPMTGAETNANDLINALTIPMNVTDSLALGAPSALLRQFAPSVGADFDANNENNWKQALTGQVIGAIGGTKGISLAGRGLSSQLGRAGEVLRTGGGLEGQLARNIGADAAYSAGYAGTQGENPLTFGAAGAAGSLAGNAVGAGIGRALTGVQSSKSVNLLRQSGVTPTIGQIMRGRATDSGGKSFVAGLEDTVANTSMAGSMVNTARNDALEQANNAAFRIGAGGAPITGVGEDALRQFGNAKTNAYADFAAGVNMPIDDPRFVQQLDNVDAGRGAGEFGNFIDTKLAPTMSGSPTIGGTRLQEVLRMLRKNNRTYSTAATMTPAFGDVADALGQVENAFIANAARNAPKAIPKLKIANRLNRNMSILDDAAGAANNNQGVFTGAQLGNSIGKDAQRFSGGRGLSKRANSPLHRFQQAMQAVLPNEVAPTGVNAAPALALGGVALGAGNEASGLDSNIVRALAATAMLSTPYTKTGAKTIASTLLDRPDQLVRAGQGFRKGKGLFGTAGAVGGRAWEKNSAN